VFVWYLPPTKSETTSKYERTKTFAYAETLLEQNEKNPFFLEKQEKVCKFALEESKTVRQPLGTDTHYFLCASQSLHTEEIKM